MSELRKSRSDKILEQMVPTICKFQTWLRNALDRKESGWHRINIRLDNGVVTAFTHEVGSSTVIENIAEDDVDTP